MNECVDTLFRSEAKGPRSWWRGAVIYQVYPRSFADSNGDGIGDLAGVTAHLDYIHSLGVDAIWLSPFFTSPMLDYGYDVADYCDVDPIFGTLDEFDKLIEGAHQRGLKVIIDQVYSHTSDAHQWFSQSRANTHNPRADWYVWADAKPDGSPPNNWQSVFGGPAWTWDARRGQYYMHNFLSQQPDLNVHNPAVQDALLDVARFWLDRGVDGFRLDALNFAMHDPLLRDNPVAPDNGRPRSRPYDFQRHIYSMSHPDIPSFLERIRSLMDSYRDRFTVAEVGGAHALDEMRAFTAGDTHLNSAYGFNFLYASSLTPALVQSALSEWPAEDGVGWPSWAFSNHDAPRAVSRWAMPEHRDAFARLAMLLLVSLRGNIFIYQGEELGLNQAKIAYEHLRDPEAIANWPHTLGRDGARTPMPWRNMATNDHCGFSTGHPWLPIEEHHRKLAVDVQEHAQDSMLQLTRRLVRVRHQHQALMTGIMTFVIVSDTILAFTRGEGADQLLTMINLSHEPQTIAPPAGALWRVIEAVGGAGIDKLPPLSGYIARKV